MLIFVYLNKRLAFQVLNVVYILLFVDSEAQLSENWLLGGIYSNLTFEEPFQVADDYVTKTI